MKKGFPHCDTPESLELVQAQFPTLFLELLGNHQILLWARVEAATFISQYKSLLLVVVSMQMKMVLVLVLCLQGQMAQDIPASSIPNLDESRSMVMSFYFRFYQDLEWHLGIKHVEGFCSGKVPQRILDCCFETRPRKCWSYLALHQEKSKTLKSWFGSYLKHSLKLNKRAPSLSANASAISFTCLEQTSYSNDGGQMDNAHGCDQGWALLCKS